MWSKTFILMSNLLINYDIEGDKLEIYWTNDKEIEDLILIIDKNGRLAGLIVENLQNYILKKLC